MGNAITVPEITPSVLNLDSNDGTLYLDTVGDTVTITCVPWADINPIQSVTLFIDDISAGTAPPSVDPKTGTDIPPIFAVPTKKYFTAGTTSTVYMVVLKPDGTPNPDRQRTQSLVFPVKANALGAALKIDITEGAAPYSDKHPYLMPADFAVIRGPAGKKLDAHARGNFVFQDLGNASSVTFTIDEPGTATLSLIRLGFINPVSAAAAASDVLYLTAHKDTEELTSHPVVFGDYTPLTGDAARQFQSVSCNTVGIADGETVCIVSIVMQPSNKDSFIVVGLDSGLKISENDLNKPIHFTKFNNLYKVDIVEGTSEFAVSAKKSKTYGVTVSAASDTDAFFQKSIKFKDLK